MNIQQFYEEKEREDQKKTEGEISGMQTIVPNVERDDALVIPVVQEQAHLRKEEVETGKVRVQTSVVEIEKSIDVPLMKEGYEVKRVPVDELIDQRPSVREEGDHIIIPVVEEVLVVQKRLRLVDEVHLIKRQTTVTKTENFTLKKEEVTVERIPTDNKNKG